MEKSDIQQQNNAQNKLVPFRLQYFLGLTPFLGLFVVVFCGFFNIYKVSDKNMFKSFPRIALYWIFICLIILGCLIPSIVIISLGLLQSLDNQGLVIFLILILFAIPLMVVAILAVFVQQKLISKCDSAK